MITTKRTNKNLYIMHTKEELNGINAALGNEEKTAIVRSKKLLYRKRMAAKGHAFYIVEAVHKKQRFTRVIELSALPTKKHEEAVYEELEAFLLKDMGISVPSEF